MSTIAELSRTASLELSPSGAEAALESESEGNAAPIASVESASAGATAVDEDTPSLPPRPEDEHVPITAPAVAAQGEQEMPQVTALRLMFPDFDATVLLSVLESVDYNQDRAVDVLLGMSDPDYVSAETPAAPQQADLDLDEQLARQLALEDQERQQNRASGQSWPRRDQGGVPYQPRQGHGQPPQNPQDGGGDFQQEVQETFTRIAESGKRTFSSILSKAKAKYNEYQQSRPAQQSGGSSPPQWDSTSPHNTDRHTLQEEYQQASYNHEPNYADTPRGQISPPVPSKAPPIQGYDVDSYFSGSSSLPSSTTPSDARGRSPLTSPRPSGDAPPPPPTLSGGSINAAKLGLLPKRHVSLLSSQPPAAQPSHPSDDDELEYVENPFEEGH